MLYHCLNKIVISENSVNDKCVVWKQQHLEIKRYNDNLKSKELG